MRKLLIVLAILTFATAAFAGTVTVKYNSSGSNFYGGVATYPYNGSVNGVPTDFMCVSYNEHITGGESWQANVLTVDQWGATLPGGVLEAQKIANFYLLQKQYPADSWFNADAWYMLEGSPDIIGDPTAMAFYNAINDIPAFGRADIAGFNTVRVYVPVDVTGDVPQTFLGSTPEPSTLLTLGSGLIGLAGLARKSLFN